MKSLLLFIALLFIPLFASALNAETPKKLSESLGYIAFLTPVFSYFAILLSGLAKKLPKAVTLMLVPILGVISTLIANKLGGDVNFWQATGLSLGAVFIEQFIDGLTRTKESRIEKAKETIAKLEK